MICKSGHTARWPRYITFLKPVHSFSSGAFHYSSQSFFSADLIDKMNIILLSGPCAAKVVKLKGTFLLAPVSPVISLPTISFRKEASLLLFISRCEMPKCHRDRQTDL